MDRRNRVSSIDCLPPAPSKRKFSNDKHTRKHCQIRSSTTMKMANGISRKTIYVIYSVWMKTVCPIRTPCTCTVSDHTIVNYVISFFHRFFLQFQVQTLCEQYSDETTTIRFGLYVRFVNVVSLFEQQGCARYDCEPSMGRLQMHFVYVPSSIQPSGGKTRRGDRKSRPKEKENNLRGLRLR